MKEPKKTKKLAEFTARILLPVLIFSFSVQPVFAAPIKILSNTRHAYSTIISTINQLLGRTYTSAEFVIHSTSLGSIYTGGVTEALSDTSRYNESGVLVSSQAPYQLYTSSFSGYNGDFNTTNYNYSATYDLADNYAYIGDNASWLPPAFRVAPGWLSQSSGHGVEWRIDPVLFCSSTLSCTTAANAGILAWLRFLHPTWNWFDTKAALRQNGSNWATGYSTTAYGFGLVDHTAASTLTDGQILLQPPAATIATSTGRISFTVYPFKQTRRVKEVLFQFSGTPTFQENELTLAEIQAIGGTKITEYTGVTATTTTPIYVETINAYFVWFTADNATDSAASFSRIDTYSVLGPASQNEVSFDGTFNIVSPSNNTTANTPPTFSWGAASSYLGISKYQLFIDGVLDTDNISGTSTTPTASLSDGAHTWYVKVFNGGGAATTTTSTPTVNILSGYASGYTFYVDNVLGNNNNPGTQALPWVTLTKAASTVTAGDSVVIIKNAGVPYRETLTPSNAGDSGAQITYRGVDANSKPEIWGSTDLSSGWSIYGGGNSDTYQQAFTTDPWVFETGASLLSLTKRTWASSAATLNPGEWYWTGNVLYYRLAAGEALGSVHIEVSSRSYGISNSTTYVTYQDIVVRYVNAYGAAFFAGNGVIVQGIEVYDSAIGVFISASGTTMRYSIIAGNEEHGLWNAYANSTIYNSLVYGNSGGGINFEVNGSSGATVKNTAAVGNDGYSFWSHFYSGTPSFTTSNNSWDIAGDAYWGTNKGSNNQELVDSLLVATSTRDFRLQSLSPNIDTGTTISGLTTDILGNPIYGTPDIGPYEYQPPYTIGTNNIDITSPIRLYKNGKYRSTTATSSTPTATMNITPIGGFPAGDYSEWLNVTISTWNTSGDYAKTWTETSTTATSTVHTVGDLVASTYYTVNVDGTQYVATQSDDSGQISFTYTGGYSTHTFDISADTTGPLAFSPSSPANGAVGNSSQTFTWSATTDASAGLSKYQLYVDGGIKEDNIATTSTQTSATGFTCGSHPWYVRAVDNAGNGTNSGTYTFTVACGGGIFTGPASSLPGYVTPRMQTIAPDGTVTYLDEVASTTASVATTVSLPAKKEDTKTIIATFLRTLKKGSQGADVTVLQELLKKDPTLYPEGLVTGYFGALTETALKRFQKKYGIVSSGTAGTTGYGVVGPRTRGKLNVLMGE